MVGQWQHMNESQANDKGNVERATPIEWGWKEQKKCSNAQMHNAQCTMANVKCQFHSCMRKFQMHTHVRVCWEEKSNYQ